MSSVADVRGDKVSIWSGTQYPQRNTTLGSFGAVLQWMEVLATRLLWRNTFTTLLGPFRYVRGLSLTSSPHSPDFVAALAVGVSPRAGFDIFIFQLQYRIDFFSATLRRDTRAGGSWNDWYPIITVSSRPGDYFVVWPRNLPDGTSDMVGQSYVPSRAGQQWQPVLPLLRRTRGEEEKS